MSSLTTAARRIAAIPARLLVAAALALGCSLGAAVATPGQAHAANDASKDAYKYTVRVFSGMQGNFANGKDCWEFQPMPYGASVSFNQGNVVLDDADKYYVRGWKMAGDDNDQSTLFAELPVTSDMDLVVCYGVLVDRVGYTVRYVDAAGNELLPTESFYGNIGDRPVLAYRYVEGFLPQAYNLTGELYADASQNVYTFTYNAVASPEDITVITPTAITPAAGAGAGEAGAGAAAPEDAPAVAVEAPPAEELIGDDGTPLAEPADIEDIRDEETPLAAANALARTDVLNEGAEMLLSPTNLVAVLGFAAVAAVAIALALILMYRKKQHQAVAQAARAEFETNFPGHHKHAGAAGAAGVAGVAGAAGAAGGASVAQPGAAGAVPYAAPGQAGTQPGQPYAASGQPYGDQFDGQYGQGAQYGSPYGNQAGFPPDQGTDGRG